MASARIRLATLVIALLAVVPACGGSDTPAGDATGSARPWHRYGNEYVALDRPHARQVRADTHGDRQLVLNLLPFGDVKLRGNVWPLVTGSEAERTVSLMALRRAWQEADEAPDGEPPPLMLNVDRCANWSWVEQVLQLALVPPSRLARLRWTVWVQDPGRIAHQEAAVVPIPAGSADRPSTRITGVTAEDGGRETRLSIGDWSTTTTRPCDDWGEGLDSYRGRLEVWQDASAVLRERVVEHAGVELAFDGDPREVEWRHVVRLFDLLLGAGIREVDLPGLGVRLVLDEPQDTSKPPFRYPAESVASPLAAILAVVAVALAFVLTFAGGMRSGRVRPPRSRST